MKNFIKGFIVGVAGIIPGLSGTAILILFNLYEDTLSAISNIFNNFKQKIIFLFPITIGMLLGMISFSNVINSLLIKYPVYTYIIFIFLILGTFPTLINQTIKKGFKKRYLISFLIAIIIGITLLLLGTNIKANQTNEDFPKILIGGLVSISTIIPGISTTVLLSVFDVYKIYLEALGELNMTILFPISIGFLLTSFFLSKMITKLLEKHYGYTYFAILGFMISTIPALIPKEIIINKGLIISIILGILASIITNKILNTKEKPLNKNHFPNINLSN